MTKKKIGELDGTPIVTGDKNYANEHEYYMTLNGDNTYQKLEQRTNGDLFRTVLGGSDSGSGNTGFVVYASNYRDLTDKDQTKLPSSPVYNNDECLDLQGVAPIAIADNDYKYLKSCAPFNNEGFQLVYVTLIDNMETQFFADKDFTVMAVGSLD